MVEFKESGYIKRTRYKQFKEGKVKSPYCKTVCHKGYLGEGEYTPRDNSNKYSRQYITWHSMLQRCYSKKYQLTRPTYEGCIVCDEWLNFQNFGKWYDENFYTLDENNTRIMSLDKDILKKGNKIYCPEYCVFVPSRINLLFIRKDANRGILPIGVYKDDNRYSAQCMIEGIYENLGYHDTPEEAFNTYKIHKEKYIKQVADKYKNVIPEKLYNGMYQYQVEITD